MRAPKETVKTFLVNFVSPGEDGLDTGASFGGDDL
jgi:hypothetical protein